jgi:hypothetical protein
MIYCENCGQRGAYRSSVQANLCDTCLENVVRQIEASEIRQPEAPAQSRPFVKVPADSALAELMETVYACERQWRTDDRFDSLGRYGE